MHTAYAYVLDNRDGVVEYKYEATGETRSEARWKAMKRAVKCAMAKNEYEEDMRFVPISSYLGEKLGVGNHYPFSAIKVD